MQNAVDEEFLPSTSSTRGMEPLHFGLVSIVKPPIKGLLVLGTEYARCIKDKIPGCPKLYF